MVDFKKLLASLEADRRKPRFVYVYKCDMCLEEKMYSIEMPKRLRSHFIDAMRYPRCKGMQHLVRIVPEDPALARCPACHKAGRSDPAKSPAWIDPACATCGGLGAVKKDTSE